MDSDMFEEILDNIEEMASTSALEQLEGKVWEARRDGVDENVMADAVEALTRMQASAPTHCVGWPESRPFWGGVSLSERCTTAQAIRRFDSAKQEKQKGGYLGLFGGSASLLEPSGPSNRPETRKVETVAIGERQRPVRGDQPSRDPQLTEQLQHKCIERLRFALKDGMTTCAQH